MPNRAEMLRRLIRKAMAEKAAYETQERNLSGGATFGVGGPMEMLGVDTAAAAIAAGMGSLMLERRGLSMDQAAHRAMRGLAVPIQRDLEWIALPISPEWPD
jgi:hypothetical protein